MKHHRISLLEVIWAIKNNYRDYVIAVVQNHKGDRTLPFQTWEFDHLPFMEALLKEIFDVSIHQSQAVTQHSQATQILMQHGIDRDTAVWMTQQAFQATIDTLVAHVPDIDFGNPKAFAYGLCEVYDILISELPTYSD